MGDPSDLTWSPDHEQAFGDLPTAKGEAPQLLTGVVEGDPSVPPPDLVVVVNGTVAGVTGAYLPRDGAWRFWAYLGPYLRVGANEIDAYEVVDGPAGAVLHPVG
ncbi:MAG: hypothetical protein ABL966_04955 [Acidimicrobiales bacterium]